MAIKKWRMILLNEKVASLSSSRGLCRLVAILAILSFVLVSHFSFKVRNSFASKRQGVSLDLKPGFLYQGGISRVILHAHKGDEIIGASFAAKRLPLKKIGRSDYICLIGVGLKEKPGYKKLEIKLFSPPKGTFTISKNVMVKRKKYPEEHLKVPGKMVEFPPHILERVLSDQKAVRRACATISRKIYWNTPFIWPVRSKLLSPFGLRRFFNGKPRSPHSGIDLRARTGTPIKASNNGRVALVRNCYLSGNTIVIDHGGGLFTLYAHLSKVEVKNGQEVRRGQVIGLAGATGRVTGPHLHWGVSLLGARVDPVQLIGLLGS